MNDRAVAAQVLRARGMTLERVGELLGVNASTVHRWMESLADEAPPERSALDDLETLLATQDLDDMGRMNAGIARRLAVKLDKASESDKAQDSMAIAQIAKELRNVVEAIVDVSADDREWVVGLFE